MRTKFRKITASFLALIMALGVLTVAPFTVSAAGNSTSTATNYTLGNTVYGSITSNNSSDFYKFTIPTSGRVKLDVNAGIVWAYYHIYDSNGNTMFGVNRKWNGTTEIMTMSETIDLTSGTYYFNVEKDGGYTGSYHFKLSFTSANESFKETGSGTNNNLNQANSISLNTTYNGQIAVNDDKDFYKFTIPTSGRVKLDVNAGIAVAYYRIYDSNGNTMFDNWRWWDGTAEIMTMSETIDLTSGTYYFNVEKDRGYTGSYHFKLSFTSANESFKETGSGTNNNLNQANSISLNTTYNGQIAVNDDKDFYKFTIPTSGRVKLDVNAGIAVAYYRIYDSNGNTMFDNWRWWDGTAEIMTMSETIDLTSGTYYFNVEKDRGYTGNYKFSITNTVSPTSIILNKTSVTLGAGETYTLTKTVYPSNASTSCTWSSSNTGVASVSNGKITAKGTGSATVTVRTANGKTASCKVTVKSAPTSVKTNPASVTLGVGEKYTISESTNSGTYANADNLKWSSSNANIVAVTKDSANKAVVTARGTGTAYVKIALYNGKTAQCKVTVKSAPSSVKTNPASVTLGVGEKYTISESTDSGSYANADNLKWSSSNSNIVAVTKDSANKAVVTARGTGTAYVKITLYNGKTATCTLTVKAAPTSVKLSTSNVILGKGETFIISQNSNSGSYAKNFTWSSSNSNVASIAKTSGNKAQITAKTNGTATITFRTYNGKTATCKVTVKNAPSSVKTNVTSVTLGRGETYTISESTNSGTYANADNLRWSSTNTSVVQVVKGSGNKATITAQNRGTAYVKITLYNGKTATCKVVVK